jgi:hypothetical protein
MQCEGSLKTEYTKFEATHDKFCKDKAAHVQNFKGMPNERLLPHFLMSMAYILQVLMIIHVCRAWSSCILGCTETQWLPPVYFIIFAYK